MLVQSLFLHANVVCRVSEHPIVRSSMGNWVCALSMLRERKNFSSTTNSPRVEHPFGDSSCAVLRFTCAVTGRTVFSPRELDKACREARQYLHVAQCLNRQRAHLQKKVKSPRRQSLHNCTCEAADIKNKEEWVP